MKLLKRTWADISLNALEHNYRVIRSHVGSHSKYMAVVKADAYGHGAVPLSRAYEELGAEYLAVSNLEEAIQIRRAGIQIPIIILGYTPAVYAQEMVSLGITQEVHSLDYATELNEALSGTDLSLKIHLKLDTGMSRIGFRAYGNADIMFQAVEAAFLQHLHVEGAFMHFSVADSTDPDDVSYTRMQYSRFVSALEFLRSSGISPELCHCCNSGAILQYPEYAMDMVRAGIMGYGIEPSPETQGILQLQPVLSLHTTVSQLREYPSDIDIGYGRRFRTKKPSRIAVLSIGYADGLSRTLSNKITFLINGHRAPQVGAICMDACMVDVSDVPDVTAGTEATLIGRCGGMAQSANELADLMGTISYDILCSISKRVPRMIHRNGELVDLVQYIV